MIKLAQYVKVTEELLGDPLFLKHVIPSNKSMNHEARAMGKAVIGPFRVRTGITGDDFCRNLYTILKECWITKAPRFANPYRKEPRKNKIR